MTSVLIAEDSYSLANLLEFLLKRNGFDVCLARRGDKAAIEAQQQTFDIMVLDQQMPGLTGIEVLRSIRSGGPSQHATVYLCTAKSHELDLISLQVELDIAGVYNKPFSPRDLVETLLSTAKSLAVTS